MKGNVAPMPPASTVELIFGMPPSVSHRGGVPTRAREKHWHWGPHRLCRFPNGTADTGLGLGDWVGSSRYNRILSLISFF